VRRVVPWLAAVAVLLALLPGLCTSEEDGPTTCQSLVLLPLPWGENADTWGYVTAFAAMLATFLGLRLLLGRSPGSPGSVREMADHDEQDDHDEIVHQSALQLWAAAQTDFDPYEVPPEEWRDPVPVRDADIATDTRLELDAVRDSLRRLDGTRLVLGEDGGTLSVTRVISEGGIP
jgi:hypothetical protein